MRVFLSQDTERSEKSFEKISENLLTIDVQRGIIKANKEKRRYAVTLCDNRLINERKGFQIQAERKKQWTKKRK